MFKFLIFLLLTTTSGPNTHFKLRSIEGIPCAQDHRPSPILSANQSALSKPLVSSKAQQKQMERLAKREMKLKYKSLQKAGKKSKVNWGELLLSIWVTLKASIFIGAVGILALVTNKLFLMGLGWWGLMVLIADLLFFDIIPRLSRNPVGLLKTFGNKRKLKNLILLLNIENQLLKNIRSLTEFEMT